MLISADRYDKLKKTHTKHVFQLCVQLHVRAQLTLEHGYSHNREDFKRLGLVRVHPSFRVIALGLPVMLCAHHLTRQGRTTIYNSE
jgi:hypothetical protein